MRHSHTYHCRRLQKYRYRPAACDYIRSFNVTGNVGEDLALSKVYGIFYGLDGLATIGYRREKVVGAP